MKGKMPLWLLTAVAALLLAALPSNEAAAGNFKPAANPADADCLKCHQGIEQISDGPVMSKLTCVQCHQGNSAGTTMEAAHQGMFSNPTDLRVVEQTCGSCHGEDVKNAKKSLHATMAGMISGTRYTWGAQETKNALYATYEVSDDNPDREGALKGLKQLPMYDPAKPMSNTNHPADDYLRNQCLRCHIWSEGARQDGDYRASGCAACHVVYDDDGLYRGGDRAIDKKQKGRPEAHRITTKIPEYQCIHCHNRGGRTGVSFIGTMESDEYGSPWGDEAGKKGGAKLHGKYYNHLTADIHYEKGMTCIDCHTKSEMHGDGNVYSKKHQGVEVRCETCHGSAESLATLQTAHGNRMDNLKKNRRGQIIMTSKMDGKERVVPQVHEAMSKGSLMARSAKAIPGHMNRLECYACHADWAPQCYGCHAQQDASAPNTDWINTSYNLTGDDPSRGGTAGARNKTAHSWKETRSYLRWETPVLGINQKGKVSPFIPGCQAIFTQIGPDGKATVHNRVFTTYDGFSGLSHNPIQPHTISKKGRSCQDCHGNTKAVGLGGGIYNTRANGVDVPFELERIVDEDGRQLQSTSHYGARPFNKEELDRVMRVGVCISCHDADESKTWQQVTDVVGFAETDEKHRQLIKQIFRKGVR